ncbi:polyisoprenoid-binding protein YceI [Pedobacter sp. UYP30]|uniref:YceI family protein n=1 Tax=Pedobacter sp. UYP30 TaxID=1756400 RepID=UPI003392F4B8
MTNTKTWVVDPMHSDVLFKIKHLVISTVTGSFKKFEGKITSEIEGFNNAKINFEIDVNSIDTNQDQRDEHLKSGDFFEANLYPKITFESTAFVKTEGSDYKLNGNLTMKGVTKPISLNVEYGGSEDNGHGVIKHGFEVTGIVNRKEFGMTWNKLTDSGGLGLGEDIKLIANIQVAELVETAVEPAA